jgi:hypothetical protein
MSANLIIYGSVYDHVDAALDDLSDFEQLNTRELVGPYDAAVIDVRDGRPRVFKRMNHPTLDVVPELVARGRPPIGVLAEPLKAGEVGLAIVGTPELANACRRAIKRASMTSERAIASTELGVITQTA